MSTGRVYYNEHDKKAAAWLRELMKDGQIPDGEVDTRSILDVRPGDLDGFLHCHFFAGIGGWALALRLAEWPDDREIWTGSCPCQPFSAAGAGAGVSDDRHLWPFWFWLIEQRRPACIAGEQVEAAIEFDWIDLVCTDLEGIDYAVGAVPLPAACVRAFHIRQRAWFMADRDGARRGARRPTGARDGRGSARVQLAGLRDAGTVADAHGRRARKQSGVVRGDEAQHGGRPAVGDHVVAGHGEDGRRGLGDSERAGLEGHTGDGRNGDQSGRVGADARGSTPAAGAPGALADAGGRRSAEHEHQEGERASRAAVDTAVDPGPGGVADDDGGVAGDGVVQRGGRHGLQSEGEGAGFWDDVEWIPCRDGKLRPTQPGLQPLAHGVSGRVGLLRGAGNAIVPELAAEVLIAYLAEEELMS